MSRWRVRLYDGECRVGLAPARSVWIELAGPIPDELRVLHACDFPVCVRLSHLFLGTQSDNMRDMHAKGRGPKQAISQKRMAKLLRKKSNREAHRSR